MLGNAQGQSSGNSYQYGNDHYKVYPDQKKSSDVNIQKIKCVNSNLNVNGVDVTKIQEPDGLATTAAEATNEDGARAANEEGAATDTQQNGNELADRINFDRNLVNVCANVNANDQIRLTEPEPASLTVNKEVFGCDHIGSLGMDCRLVQDGSSSWLPCIGSSISNSVSCQGIPANLFDIEVLDSQNTQLQQFEGSAQGTTIQNLQPDTYTVNEIKHQSFFNQLSFDATVEQRCVDGQGFSDGGLLLSISQQPNVGYSICFEYEDEQGNDCSTVTLTAGENKVCTVKNYIRISTIGQ
jgi:hypothetical protein